MTEPVAHRALDTALKNDTDDLYYEGQLSPTLAGECLMNVHDCDEEVAFEFAFSWIEQKESQSDSEERSQKKR